MDLINYLMDEAFIEIFGYLSHKTIKNCSLVCKRWNNIISNSKEIMDKFQIKLISTGSCEKAKEVTRKHYTMVTSYLDEDFLDIIRCHNLHTLTVFSNSVQFKLSDMVKVLNNVPQFKILRLCADFIDDFQDAKDAPKVRLNLNELFCPPEIFHILNCASLKDLIISCSEALNSNIEMIFDFMNRQKNLLNLEVLGFNLLPASESFNCQFKLKSLRYIDGAHSAHEDIITFLELHKNTLEVLKIDLLDPSLTAMEQIQKYILKNMLNLKDLSLDLQIMQEPGEEMVIEMTLNEPHQATWVTKNIEKLKFNTYHRSVEENKRFIDMFPKIKHLTVDSDFGEYLHHLIHHISTTKPTLESLKIYHLLNILEPKIFFPNLKVITFKQFWAEEDLDPFINRHSSTLEEIVFNRTYQTIKESTIAEINKCKNLKKIKFHSNDQKSLMLTIHGLFKFLSVSKPLEVTFSCCRLFSTTLKFPEDALFLDESLFDEQK